MLSAFGAALFLNGDLTLTRGIYLTGTQSQLGFGRFDATPSSMSVRGGGTVFLQNPSAQVVIDGNTTLTIEAGSTVSGIGRVGLD